MALNISAMPLGLGAGSSGAPMNTIEQALHENHENDTSLLSTSHGSTSSQSDMAQSTGANDDDEDTDMSVDGGVPIPLTNSSAQQLNMEMDMLDAEVMGSYNIATIAPNSGFHGELYPTDDDSLDQFTTYAQEDDGFGTSYTPSVTMGEPLEADQPMPPIDPISQLSEQLQNIQNGQQLGSGPDVVSAGPHGLIPSNVEDQRNLTLGDFLLTWGASVTRYNPKKRRRGPNLVGVERMRAETPSEILDSNLRGERCDFQGIDWTKLEVSRREARDKRNHSYRNYTNLRTPGWHDLTINRSTIDNVENFYKFRRMDFKPRIGLAHFQLRNLLACTSRSNVLYAGESKIYSVNPLFNQRTVKMDLTDPIVQTTNSLPFSGIQISTLAADHNVVVAGGFSGEYAMKRIDAPHRTHHIEGLVTRDPNPITNHVQIHLSRQSGLPQVAFASNDGHLRVLDCTTNKFTSEQSYSYPINCSAISPDHRLRVLVGDSRNVTIVNAETGDLVQSLDGHEDYGFACAWADNGWHVATGNQDKLIKIWDARMWTDAYGVGKPLQTIAATIAGVRSMKFSPLGSGKRVLVAAESADIVSVIDAESYTTKQTLDFYGETCGVDFSPDGRRLFVGIHDPNRGGIMEFQKCGFGQYHAERSSRRAWDENGNPRSRKELEMHDMAAGLDWRPSTESVAEDLRSRRTATYERRRAALSYDMEP